MARRVPARSAYGVPSSAPLYNVSFLLFVLPLLALVAVGRRKHAAAKSRARNKAKASAKARVAQDRSNQGGGCFICEDSPHCIGQGSR